MAGGQPGGPVSSLAAEQAAAWCDYLESHARRTYGLVADVSIMAAAELAQKIQKGILQDGFTAREVYKKHWRLLGEKEPARDACAELVEAGWLREEIQKDGKTRSVFRINPKIFPSSD